jgi:tetratricopeptide (TPR) repeat protein/transcriptional regulator with XRE-family HTH domain
VGRAREVSGRRLTCRELADITGYSHSAINNWLGGRTIPTADRLGDLLTALGATPDEQRMLATARDEIVEGRLAGSASSSVQEAPAALAGSRPPLSPGGLRHSLPADVAAFTGRDQEMGAIIAAAADAARTGSMAVHVVAGMPGVGKTALAVHVAHTLKDMFPDRALFIDLHAHTPGHDPVVPEEALAGLLAAVGVQARYLPEDLDGRVSMWRDRMAGQRAVLVLDNAASSDQIIPLLPGSAGCLVLVTSRRHVGDLPGTAPVLLEAMPPDEAQEMFRRLAPRADCPPAAVAELTQLAGLLPLAISLLARVRAWHPSWAMADLVSETRTSLLTLTAEKESIAAAFEVSYRCLPPGQQDLFRGLGLHPGTSVDAYAAAALTGTTVHRAVKDLDALHREGLLTEAGHRRYGMHDLLRSYARDRAAAEPPEHRSQRLQRLLDYYQHAAGLAESLLARQARPNRVPADPALPPAAVLSLPDGAHALAWARIERANLLACLDHVTRTQQHARVIALTEAVASLLRQDGPWADAITRHTAALRSARCLGDRLSEANALSNLGTVRYLTGKYQSAAQAHDAALTLYQELGSRQDQANALTGLGIVRYLDGDYPKAIAVLGESLDLYRQLGDQQGQANALNELGVARYLTGDFPSAAEALGQALNFYRELGDAQGEASALSNSGAVLYRIGDCPEAVTTLTEALSIYRGIGDHGGVANVLNLLGSVQRLAGEYSAAAKALEEALAIYGSIGDRRRGRANTLADLASVWRQTGDTTAAAEALTEALDIYRSLRDRGGEAEALNELGALYRQHGDLSQAEACHKQALVTSREIDSSFDEAHALAALGRCALASDRAADAISYLREAQEIFSRIGANDVGSLTAELNALTEAQVHP